MSLLRASDLLQLQFQVSHPAIMHRTKMLVKRRGVFAVQRTKMNFDQILSVDKLVTLLSVWRNLNLILHHISWCISCKIDPDFSHRGREDKKLKKANALYGTSQEIGRTNLCAVHSQARLGNFFMHFLLCIHLPSLQQDVPELNGVSRL